jgi:hypothetical protein
MLTVGGGGGVGGVGVGTSDFRQEAKINRVAYKGKAIRPFEVSGLEWSRMLYIR